MLTYDSLARVVAEDQQLDRSYVIRTAFDEVGRPAVVTYPSGLAVRRVYSTDTATRGPGLSGGSRSVFWSGWGAKSEAANFGTTLEKTPIGRFLDLAQGRGWLGDGAVSRWTWHEASATFAGNATGQAQTVIRFHNPSSVFYKVELPILQRNGVAIQPR